MGRSRVIGADAVEVAHGEGRFALEILPGDIVTELARERAGRLGLRLVDGPVEVPAPARADGAAYMRRGLYRRSPRWRTFATQDGTVPGAGRGAVARGSGAPSSSRKLRKLRKIAVFGAGGVGAQFAHLASLADIAVEIALIDAVPGLAASVALDIEHSRGVTESTSRCIGGQSPKLVADADLVVVTAGRPRSPGMSRADLADANARVVRLVSESIRESAPESVVIVVTNPLDEMTAEALRATGFPRGRVLGMAGTLDSARFRVALANATGCEPAEIEALALGSHGDEMVAVESRARVRGRSLAATLSGDGIADCVRDTVTGGGQVVALRRTGSATIAPAHAVIELVDRIRGAKAGPVPVSVMLEGEYGIDGVVLGVPAHLGASGLVEIERVELSESETAALRAAAEAVRGRMPA